MTFTETALKGAWIIDLQRIDDERGFFARSFCQDEFTARGLKTAVAQCNVSFNLKRGTLRGMHFQLSPKAEAKLVRCTRGAIYDVIIDLRPESATYCQWRAVELTADNRRALYIPEGFAHGFQTLADDSELFYQMFEFFAPECAAGVRWDDPAFGIDWPLPDPIMSEKDRGYAPFLKNGRGVWS
ncbi:dTDP-4-dehydrorhamnose 3,5-epimerase [Geobacter pickeringii]|uniref:dTDP-4-dehydrorhamnose 3,5-epimerase n=1 Tax=Geobacter pickeringii TaxID=345632 RepID=A0A0B5BBQ4_9BACT|nr:dTDP-4-dehydrorhamnose 3,5-epimerase [Geobacter pickeringii]AJE04193.1 dTDP-4-dehydrorhamnose 3,5-epimerase [Geobacter pickeringii]